jgi:cytochrome c
MKLLTCISLTSLLLSCGSKKPEKLEAEPTSAPIIISEGEQLILQSDCKTCHHQVNKIIGPSFSEVATRYEFTTANLKLLAGRIIEGSSGVWGEIPMNPHTDLSEKDAVEMMRYILSLDGESEK